MKDREKQIEEMAKSLCQLDRDCAECSHSGMCQATKYANRVYNAGYRKQSVGEWKFNDSDKQGNKKPYRLRF